MSLELIKKLEKGSEIIDREYEREKFQHLLELKGNKRILAICDKDGGMGKSHLLRNFQYHCKSLGTPVCLFDLKELSDVTPFGIVKYIISQLERQGVPFSIFDQFKKAKIARDRSFIYRSTNLHGITHLDGADFRGATGVSVTGTYIETYQVEYHTQKQPELTEDELSLAQEQQIVAFFKDILTYCRDKPIVLILDTFEKCLPDNNKSRDNTTDWERLAEWIYHSLLRILFFPPSDVFPNHKLLLVVAGKEIPDFEDEFPRRYMSVVEFISELSVWEQRHVEGYCKVIGMDYEDKHIETFCNLIEMDLSLLDLLRNIKKIKMKLDTSAKVAK